MNALTRVKIKPPPTQTNVEIADMSHGEINDMKNEAKRRLLKAQKVLFYLFIFLHPSITPLLYPCNYTSLSFPFFLTSFHPNFLPPSLPPTLPPSIPTFLSACLSPSLPPSLLPSLPTSLHPSLPPSLPTSLPPLPLSFPHSIHPSFQIFQSR